MELTAERLETKSRRKPVNWLALLIGGAPLSLLVLYLVISGGSLFSEPDYSEATQHFPAVAIVSAISESEDRRLPLTGLVKAELSVSLRAEVPSFIEVMAVRPGQRVAAGQQVCRLRPTRGGEAVVQFSPIDGVVGSTFGRRGARLNTGEACATVYDPKSLVVLSALEPRHAEIISAGNKVVITEGGVEHESNVRVIYPPSDSRGLNQRTFEVPIPEGLTPRLGSQLAIAIETDLVVPPLIPFRTLMLDPELGISVRVVHGTGAVGVVETVPVTLVATAKDGFYVDGLPANSRLIVQNSEFPQPREGEQVRIGRVG